LESLKYTYMLKEALTTVICLHRDPVEGTGGAPLPGTLKDKQKGIWKWSLSLYGTWREGSSTVDHDRHVKKKTLENSRIQWAW